MEENRKIFRNRTHPTEKNYFDRLPTELIISILERIADAKSLCICYSVCKYFATHVVQTRFVSVEIPSAVGEIPIWPPGVINFLKKLCCVESAAIQFCPRTNPLYPSTSQPLVRWKSDLSRFFFVFAECHGTTSVKATRSFASDWFSSIETPLLDFRLRLHYVQELVLLIPNLKHVSAADSMKQGIIIIEEQDIASIKNKKIPWDVDGGLCIKSRMKRKVKLPFTGRVMRNVALFCDGLTAESLLEENHEYREVAMTMTKKSSSCDFTVQSADGPTIADALYNSLLFIEMFAYCPWI